MYNKGTLSNLPGNKRVWNATGDEAPTTVATTTGTAATPAQPSKCSDCMKKKIACVLAGALIGVVATLLFKKGAKAA